MSLKLDAPVSEQRVLLRVRGVVQGVGFRPFVHRTAQRLNLSGWVRNDAEGVLIYVGGDVASIDELRRVLVQDAPPAARVNSVETLNADLFPAVETGEFSIVESETSDAIVATSVPVDLGTCADCRREFLDPSNRRFHYPFINCTQCGPRYSIIERLPYDRPQTTMRAFTMCAQCQAEYEDPEDRRFHAEPNACSECGPQLTFTHRGGAIFHEETVTLAAALVRAGGILAVKGIGGYHLFVDATNADAVAELRQRKQREQKPFAVMFPDAASLAQSAVIDDAALVLLNSPAAPIVLLPRKSTAVVDPLVAPGSNEVGALLPYSPLHLRLMEAIGRPVVATSANLSDEPLCTSATEARERLAGIADAFLDHNRGIAHPVDDSVVRFASPPIVLRRARGFAPTSLSLPDVISGTRLCVGGQMKATVALATQDRLTLSPHLGDLASAATYGVFEQAIATLRQLSGAELTGVVCDRHPDYTSSRYARNLGLPCIPVQHHLAHILSCLLEHQRSPDNVLGVAWDGTGYGEDGTIWGGEFILLKGGHAQRFARLRPFRIPGGEAAIRDTRRSCLGLLYGADLPEFSSEAEAFGFTPGVTHAMETILARQLNSPTTTSAGRLFDGVAALLGLAAHNGFEGQAPMALETAAVAARAGHQLLTTSLQRLPSGSGATYEIDWRPLLDGLLNLRRQFSAGRLAWDFHRALARSIADVATAAGVHTVALSGGCFQNALLVELTQVELRTRGFEVLLHRELPPNDGNIAAGQALGALWNITSVTLP